MKKLISVLLVALIACSLSACGKKTVQTTVTVTASAETVMFREEMFARQGYMDMTDEEIMQQFQGKSMPYLNGRTEQIFPTVETVNKLEKEEHTYGDVYTLTGEKQDVNVLYIHGGAWVWEIDKLHVTFCDQLADRLGAKVYIPIYPLAPQADYRETYAMIQQVYEELLKQNKKIIIMGDSAGATITLGFVLSLKDNGKQLPAKVVVMAPAADLSFSNEEINAYQTRDGMLNKGECRECAKLWANGADLTQPVLSPLYGDYTDFPDTMLFVGDHDILCADDLRLFDKMCEADMNVTLVKGVGLWHVYPIFNIAEQPTCLSLIEDFCK